MKTKFIEGILLLLTYKSEFTGNHSVHVAKIAKEIAIRLKPCDDNFHRNIFIGGLLHDLGKINVKDTILEKTSRLTELEYQEIKQHVIIGSEILKDFCNKAGYIFGEFTEILNNCILYHHEKFNGDGYPYGIKVKSIPLESRIIAVADVFDALYSKRPYKPEYKIAEVIDKILKDSGEHFDPVTVEVLYTLYKEGTLEKLY